MSIKDMALVKLVGDTFKKGKEKIGTLLKSKDDEIVEPAAVLASTIEVDREEKVVESIEKKPSKKSISANKTKKKNSTKQEKSKKEQKIELYTKDIKKHYGSVDDTFLEIIVKNLGPSIYRKDAESVACTEEKELETVRRNFLIKKLGFDKSEKEMLDLEIKNVCEIMKSTKIKYRATFYYILAKNLRKELALN